MAKARQQEEDLLYRVYVTEALKVTTENTAKAAIPGVGILDIGSHLGKSWLDIIRKPEKPDTRTGDEIAADILQRAGLHQKEGE